MFFLCAFDCPAESTTLVLLIPYAFFNNPWLYLRDLVAIFITKRHDDVMFHGVTKLDLVILTSTFQIRCFIRLWPVNKIVEATIIAKIIVDSMRALKIHAFYHQIPAKKDFNPPPPPPPSLQC